MGNSVNCGCVPQKRQHSVSPNINYDNRVNFYPNQNDQISPVPKIQNTQSFSSETESPGYQERYELKLKQQAEYHAGLRQRQSILNMKSMVNQFIKPSRFGTPMVNQQQQQRYKSKPKRQSRQKMANAYYEMTGRPI